MNKCCKLYVYVKDSKFLNFEFSSEFLQEQYTIATQKSYWKETKILEKEQCICSNRIYSFYVSILKTESNFTVLFIFFFLIEYLYSCFDLRKIKYFNYLPRIIRTEFRKGDSCKWFHYRVIYAYIKNEKIAFAHKFFSRPGICIQNFKDRWLSIKSPAKHLVFYFWFTIDNNLKLLHTESVSLWIKTIVNFSQLLKPSLRQLLVYFIGVLFGPLQSDRDKKILWNFPWFQKKNG